MVKLATEGVEGKLLAWITDWLSKRYQRVVVEGETFGWLRVESGMPQGTVLAGPLFTLYVKDEWVKVKVKVKVEWVKAFLRKFADDTKMVRIIWYET